ncbi:YciI family protein [Actinoplanes sp. DH11]|uniref:YciI family protein n=1 Tax=Actinoplanes sp. DH11 TaxID=2857011 RepID=UPI001E5911C0|nr:YciI family protein [Actinoplanes sp. DH11]
MWIIDLRFRPVPERLAARPAHRDRLTTLHRDGIVRMAGPLTGDTGAVIIVEAPSRPAVDALVAADPYFRTDGVEVTGIRQWEPFLR